MELSSSSCHTSDAVDAGDEADSAGSSFASAVSAMTDAIAKVESILDYQFKDRTLIVEALTHDSHPDAATTGSYQRLEFLGDSAIGCAISNHLFLTNPSAGPGLLTNLRAANVNNEQLARVAVRHNLYPLLRRSKIAVLDTLIRDFTSTVAAEYGGPDTPAASDMAAVRAPKVLADLVESIAGAVFVDCNFDLKRTWVAVHEMLKPIITEDNLLDHPVSALIGLCQKHGKELKFVEDRQDGVNLTSVFVDGKLLGEGTSVGRKSFAKLQAATEALSKVWENLGEGLSRNDCVLLVSNWDDERKGKSKLHEICSKNRWPKPEYEIVFNEGPSHDKKFRCMVRVTTSRREFLAYGDIKSKVKEAENSAACNLLHEFGVFV